MLHHQLAYRVVLANQVDLGDRGQGLVVRTGPDIADTQQGAVGIADARQLGAEPGPLTLGVGQDRDAIWQLVDNAVRR